VDGHFSIKCYLHALDMCYQGYKKTFSKQNNRKFVLDDCQFALFHAPFAKMVQKAYARLLYGDFKDDPDNPNFATVQQFRNINSEDTFTDRNLEKAFTGLSNDRFQSKVVPTLLLAKELGNIYCGSVYSCLISLLSMKSDQELIGKRILVFSYGSGLASSMFSITVAAPVSAIANKIDINARLKQRTTCSPAQFTQALQKRERMCTAAAYTPTDSTDSMFPDTFYLSKIDDKYKRHYFRKEKDSIK